METPQYDIHSNEALMLKKQIEFYFSNSNYPRDKFLRKIAADNNGYVPIKVLTTFNRVKSISQDVGLITAVLASSDELEVKDDMVKRKTAVPEKDNSIDRSIYVKGFPTNNTVTIETVSEFFSKFGDVLSIRLRRHKNRDFKGSAYIEFKSEEEAKAVLLSNELRWNAESAPFLLLPKEKHVEEKKEQLKEKKLRMEKLESEKSEKTEHSVNSEKTENSEHSIKLEKTENSEHPLNLEKTENSEHSIKLEKTENQETPKKSEPEIPANFKILEVKNVPTDIDIHDLKAYFSKFGRPKFIDNADRTGTITVRFYEMDHVDVAFNEIKDTKFQIRGNEVEARIIEQEEAQQYWKDKIKPQLGGRGNFKRGRGWGRGKGERPNKRRKLNDNE